jgi:hypothetical protein
MRDSFAGSVQTGDIALGFYNLTNNGDLFSILLCECKPAGDQKKHGCD